MTRYSDDELRAVLSYLESDRTERKRIWNKEVAKKARQAVCAFANDLPNSNEAGVLIFGANDDGTPNPDFVVDDQMLLTIADMRTDGQIVPPPSLSVQAREIGDFTYVVVIVEPSDSPPVRYDGRIWVRVGPSRSMASAQEERILIEKRQFGNRPADLNPVSTASWQEINLTRFKLEYLPAAFAKTVLEANERIDLQRLMALKLVTGASPHHTFRDDG